MLPADHELPSRGASVSEDEAYRYVLWRFFAPQLLQPDLGAILFVMLNPSTADGKKDDQTLSKISAYAQRWGFTRLWVANLFAVRSRHPSFLLTVRDPVGPDNDDYIRAVVARASATVVAWGDGPRGFADELDARARRVLKLLSNPTCLARTRAGRPGHPLYLPAAATREPYRQAA